MTADNKKIGPISLCCIVTSHDRYTQDIVKLLDRCRNGNMFKHISIIYDTYNINPSMAPLLPIGHYYDVILLLGGLKLNKNILSILSSNSDSKLLIYSNNHKNYYSDYILLNDLDIFDDVKIIGSNINYEIKTYNIYACPQPLLLKPNIDPELKQPAKIEKKVKYIDGQITIENLYQILFDWTIPCFSPKVNITDCVPDFIDRWRKQYFTFTFYERFSDIRKYENFSINTICKGMDIMKYKYTIIEMINMIKEEVSINNFIKYIYKYVAE